MAITVQEAQVLFSADGMQQVNTEAKKAAGAMDGIVSAAKRAGGALGGIRSAFSGVGGVLTTVGAAAGVTKMLSLTAEAEKTAISFEVLTGSGESARKMLDDIRKLDKKTVFGTQDLAQAQKLMMNFGMAGGEAFGVLTNLTEVAQGDTEQLMLLARGMAQVQAAGRLMGQEANQLINSGFSPLFEISKMTGRSMADLKKDMEEGKISYEMVRAALEGLTTGTGRLAGMNDRMSQSTAGQFAKFKTNVEQVAIALGSALLPEINRLLEFLNSTAESITGIGPAFSVVVQSASAWFTSTQNYFSDIGVVVGVLVGDMKTLWAGLFTDIPNYASAALTWVADNTAIAMRNISTAASNMWAKMERNSQQLGEHIAFSLGLSDEVLQIPQPTMEAMQAFAGFKPPETSAATQSVLDNINTQLAAARAEREAAMSQAATTAAAPAAVADLGFVSKEQTAAAQTMKAAGEQQRVERAGALQTFQRLQDRLQQQDKLAELAAAQLKAQQQAVTELASMNSNLDNLATLGALA